MAVSRAEAELFNLITHVDVPRGELLFSTRNAITKAILAAGWRPPARVVSTVEELEALPVGAYLLSLRTGDVWWSTGSAGRRDRWHGSGGTYSLTADFLDQQSRLVVIHEATP